MFLVVSLLSLVTKATINLQTAYEKILSYAQTVM